MSLSSQWGTRFSKKLTHSLGLGPPGENSASSSTNSWLDERRSTRPFATRHKGVRTQENKQEQEVRHGTSHITKKGPYGAPCFCMQNKAGMRGDLAIRPRASLTFRGLHSSRALPRGPLPRVQSLERRQELIHVGFTFLVETATDSMRARPPKWANGRLTTPVKKTFRYMRRTLGSPHFFWNISQ